MKFEANTLFKNLAKANPSSYIALVKLLNRMKIALEGNLEPSFYIHPIDTGFGKSTLIQIFLAVWKAEGFNGGGSILIALNTKAEIKQFSSICGLDVADYAVLTSDDTVNELGAGADKAYRVPVLFTTQSMLRKRLARKNFSVAHEFFYKGKPRTLRIWDERCNRAEPIHISRDGLLMLLSPVRPYFPEWAEGVEAFATAIRNAEVDTVMMVPATFGTKRQFIPVDGVSIGVQNGPLIGVQKRPPSSCNMTNMAGTLFALVAAEGGRSPTGGATSAKRSLPVAPEVSYGS